MILVTVGDKDVELFLHRQPGQGSFPVIEKEHVGLRFDGKPAVSDAIHYNHDGKPLIKLGENPPTIS